VELLGIAFGFVKDGKIYLSDVTKPHYFSYDPETRQMLRIPQSFLYFNMNSCDCNLYKRREEDGKSIIRLIKFKKKEEGR
jgi:hypothetical protein